MLTALSQKLIKLYPGSSFPPTSNPSNTISQPMFSISLLTASLSNLGAIFGLLLLRTLRQEDF